MKKYNIIYINSHDTGRYIDPYGYNIGTPNLMRMAQQGATFRDCHDGAPTCSPARSSLLTGTYAHQNGQVGLVNRGVNLVETGWHMANYFSKQGYDTVLAGIQHEHIDYKALGYNNGIFTSEPELYLKANDDINTKAAVEYIKNADKPYFLSIGYFETHREFLEPTVDENFIRPPEPIVDNAENRKDFAGYIASAQHMDAMVGQVLLAIEDAGQIDNTILFFTTDHGIGMPRMKCSLYSAGTGVSLIMRYPNMDRVGIATDALCSHLDVFPTLCDILELNKPDWLMGVSQLPVLEGKKESVRDEIHAEVNHHTRLEVMRCVRTKDYLYIKSLDGIRYISNCANSAPREQLRTHGYYDNKRPLVELYDLLTDPNECNNLAGLNEYKDIEAHMDQRLVNWMMETDDPFLSGEIELPFTTISNMDGEEQPGGSVFCEGDPSILGKNHNNVRKRAIAAYEKLLEG